MILQILPKSLNAAEIQNTHIKDKELESEESYVRSKLRYLIL